jgi:acyl-CoA synthetase (AMP-forming)/AMP-acid ligase II
MMAKAVGISASSVQRIWPRTTTGKVQRNKLREQLRRDPH